MSEEIEDLVDEYEAEAEDSGGVGMTGGVMYRELLQLTQVLGTEIERLEERMAELEEQVEEEDE